MTYKGKIFNPVTTSCELREIKTAKEQTKDNIKELTERLKHEKNKKACIDKLEALGIDIEILKEVLQ